MAWSLPFNTYICFHALTLIRPRNFFEHFPWRIAFFWTFKNSKIAVLVFFWVTKYNLPLIKWKFFFLQNPLYNDQDRFFLSPCYGEGKTWKKAHKNTIYQDTFIKRPFGHLNTRLKFSRKEFKSTIYKELSVAQSFLAFKFLWKIRKKYLQITHL